MSVANIAAIATPIVILLGFIFAYKQWASYRNARMAQIILSITERWDSPTMEQSRSKVNTSGSNLKSDIEQADRTNSMDLYPLIMVANFFDALGLMVDEGFLDHKMCYKLFGRAEEHYYGMYREILEDQKYLDYFKYFIKLHQIFRKEAASRLKTKPRRRP